MARDGTAEVSKLRSGLGRLSFVVGALEWERPFLAPIYAFVARQPRHGLRRLPLFVRILLQYPAARISLRRMYPSAVDRKKGLEPFRIDASAEGDRIGVGGWLPVRNGEGVLDPSLSPWFSFTLNRENAPWAYTRGLPYRSIAALEAVGVLVALIAFEPLLERGSDLLYCVPGVTDNKGNQYTISRLQTSRYPLCAVLMEIAARSEALRIRLAIDWVPRDMNSEADSLAGGHHNSFSPHHRRVVQWDRIRWLVLDWALDLGAAFFQEHARAPKPEHCSSTTAKRRKAPFRESDPWYRKKKKT